MFHMRTYDNSYSRFVAWAKVVLPVAALGVLSTLFLFSRSIDPADSIPYAKVDVEELAKEQGIGTPNYAGVTDDGSAISITATSAHPDAQDSRSMIAENLTTIIEDGKGGQLSITATHGQINSARQRLTLKDGVQIATSNGYSIRTSGLTARLDQTLVQTEGEITAEGPLGRLRAGKMELRAQKDTETGHLLVFKDGVKVVYDPNG
ncbi:MAG: LPS export ABC transporter periplasmic protein LptC [Rhodobacterales bacterium]|nr:MAG: LPS export ABC transporter periplasmic protein LptC [Rhodobacterales bacterium]